jgi:type IV secretory pathway protease TraF
MVLCLVPLLRQALMARRPEALFLTQIIICPTGAGVEQVVAVVVAAAVVAAAAELRINALSSTGVGCWGVREMVVVVAAEAAVVAAAAVAVAVVMEGVGLSDSSLSITGRTAS